MSYPLIREPSPLQQLAATITAIRGRFDERRALNEEMRRRAEYLNLAKQEMAQREAYNTQNFALQQTRIDEGRKDRELGAEAAAVQNARLATQQGFENRLRTIQSIRQGVPDNVTISADLAGRVADDPSLAYKIPGLQARATEQARAGRQGSFTRDPVIGTAGGVSVDPGTLNINIPSGGAGGGRGLGHIAERTAIGAGLMERIVTRANQLYRSDPQNVTAPLAGDVGAAVAERVLGHGAGSRVADRVRNIGATQAQTEFRGLREQFKHSMAVFFPRVSIALMENLADSYFPVGGEVGPAADAKMQALNDVFRVLQEVRAGRASPEAFAQAIGATGGAAGQALLAAIEAGEIAQPAGAQTIPPGTRRNRLLDDPE